MALSSMIVGAGLVVLGLRKKLGLPKGETPGYGIRTETKAPDLLSDEIDAALVTN